VVSPPTPPSHPSRSPTRASTSAPIRTRGVSQWRRQRGLIGIAGRSLEASDSVYTTESSQRVSSLRTRSGTVGSSPFRLRIFIQGCLDVFFTKRPTKRDLPYVSLDPIDEEKDHSAMASGIYIYFLFTISPSLYHIS
jgi:hypothetical protein